MYPYNYCSEALTKNVKLRGVDVLSDTLKKEYIQIDVSAKDFKSAIVRATEPFVQYGIVEPSYVEKIIEIYDETGPYIVITKNVALPHAPSEFGAKKLAIGLTILREPVKSGHDANDPVKFLFSLSSPDKDQHLESMSSLVKVLSSQDFLTQLEYVKNEDEVLELIKQYEEE